MFFLCVLVMIRHQPSNRVVACTGTIVSPSIIITSSRCFDSNTK
uniref:Peptidase S1 domain-containing protein n=1 Tax=Heterorhabditis bacteriophora TaxID=37862 RepID=A0A1I7WTW9_HETBA